MLKNIKDMAISRQFLISLIFISLIFAVFGVNIENSYAVDFNESFENSYAADLGENIGDSNLELNVEDKLGNSQNDEVLGAVYSLNGGNFRDIQRVVDGASEGDTIRLSGNFVAQSANDAINITKKLTITSLSTATLDGKNLCKIFYIKPRAVGTTINNLVFTNGYSPNDGGAVLVYAKSVRIGGCTFTNNYAEMSSGALHTVYQPLASEKLIVSNCKFINNGAGNAAGALGVFSYNFRIYNCVFDSNTVKNDKKNCYGGAIQVGMDTDISYGILTNCTFLNNRAISAQGVSHGGAGCVRNGTEYRSCVFINNSADHGGALTFHATGGLVNCQFYNNSANEYGGAVSISLEHSTMNLNINKCVFDGNSAPLGGAVKLSGMNIDIINSNFTDNYASKFGGAINLDAVNVTVVNSNFNDNVANINGGAVFINGINTLIKDSSFIGNDAIPDVNKLDDGLGGAVYMNSTQAYIQDNVFNYNTARNGSAVYYDKSGSRFSLTDNVMYQNQAWVYLLPVYAHDIYYGDVEEIKSIIHGGNNIAKYNNLAVSNAIYNAARNSNMDIDGETPVLGATMSGQLYQDDREYNMNILFTVTHEDGSVVYNKTLISSYLGEVSDELVNLKPGLYQLKSTHFEDTYYKGITNTTYFRVIPKVDNMVLKSANDDEFNFDDIIVWTLNITNNGPNNATKVVVRDVLPQGVEYLRDTSGGKYDPETGVLTIGNLAVGQSITIQILTVVKTTGEITNNANVTGEEYDVDLSNNNDSAKVLVNPAIDLVVKKSVNNSNPNYHDLVDWTVVVRNDGPDLAHDVKVYDVLPDSLVYVSSTGNYNINGNYWNVGTLNVGSQVVLHIVSRVNATGIIENRASASGREYDRNMSNNHDDEKINVNPATDLSIVKSVNASSVNYGDLVKWTLVVRNNGPDVASGVYVVDALPNGFVYVNSVLSKGSYSNGRFNIGNLAVGEQATINIICRVNITGNFVNVANVTGREYDYDLTNNRDDEPIHVYPASDLEVVKSVNNTNPNYHDLVDWTVVVRNNGPDVAHDVKVYDVLPDSLVYVSSTGTYNRNGNYWNVGTLNVGGHVTLHIVTKINATGQIRNDVSASGREYDFNPSNNFDNESVRVNSSCDLSIVKSVNVSSVNYGDLVKWTLVVRNNGPDVASGVYVVDALPNGFVYVNSVLSKGIYSNGRFNIGNLAVGEQATINIICRVNITGNFVNVANVTGNEYDYDLTNNEDNESILIYPASDLEVIKSVNNTNPNYGDLITWSILVKNNGPDRAHDVKVYDVLPKSLIWQNDNSLGKYNHKTGLWNIGELAKGGYVVLNIICKVNKTGEITNLVNVTGREYDYNLTNNDDNESIIVPPAADVSIEKLVNNSSPNYGELVKWTLIISNNGPDKATDVYITENLPEGLIFINYTASKGIYDNGVWAMCCLNKTEVQTLDLICKVNKTGKLVNIVSIEAKEYDPNLSNNKDNESIIVPPAVDLELWKSVNNTYPNYGETVMWTVIIRNNGPDNATGVVVEDILSSNLIFDSYVSSKGTYSNNKWNVGTLNVGCMESINISCITNALGEIDNYAEVKSNEFDWNEYNNYDVSYVNVAPVVDLAIVKLVNNTSPNYKDLVKWTLIVRNNGPNDATDVVVYDSLPQGLILVESSSNNYRDGIWNIGYLDAGDYKELELVCRVSTTGTIVNDANVVGHETDLDMSNNYDSESIDVPPASDLSITKVATKYHYNVGDLVSFSIEVVNNGPNRAKNVKVKDIMDESLKLSSYEASAGDFDKVTKTWDIDSLDLGESASLLISAVASKEGTAKNKVSASSDNYDSDLSNNNDTALVNVSKRQLDIPKIDKNHNIVDNNCPGDNAITMLEKNVSGNSFFILLMSLIFSMVFLSDNISKRR